MSEALALWAVWDVSDVLVLDAPDASEAPLWQAAIVHTLTERVSNAAIIFLFIINTSLRYKTGRSVALGKQQPDGLLTKIKKVSSIELCLRR